MQLAISCCTAPAASVVFSVLISCVRSDGVDLTLERFCSGCALRINALTGWTLICVLEIVQLVQLPQLVHDCSVQNFKISCIIKQKHLYLQTYVGMFIFAKALFVAKIQNW